MEIPKLLNKINSTIFLPTIQREFVWLKDIKKERIEKFFDSILQGYPIGQVILWSYNRKEDEEGQSFKVYKFSEEYDINSDNIQVCEPYAKSTELNYVIDGQQRLTALYLGLKGVRINKKKQKEYLCMDALYHDATENEQDDGYKIKYQFKFKTEEDVKVDNEKNNRYWVRIKDLFAVDGRDIFQTAKKFKDFIGFRYDVVAQKIGHEQAELISEKIAELHTKISHTKFHIETLNIKLEKVVDVFIRLNDGGVKLEKSDLMLSFITNISNDFRDKITNLVKELKIGKILNKDFFLKASLTILTDLEPKFEISNFKKDVVNDIFTNFDKLSEAIKNTEKMLCRYGFDEASIPSRNALIPIVYFFFKKEKNESFSYSTDKRDIESHFEIIEWLCRASISSLFSSASDGMLKKIKYELKDNNFDFTKTKSIGRQMEQKDIEEIVDKNGYKKPLLPMIINYCTSGYLKLKSSDVEYHQDHIISRDECKKTNVKEKIINSIGNIQMLPATLNLRKTNAELKVWLEEQSFNKELLLIPNNYLEMMPEQFIEERRKLIIQALCKTFSV